MLTIELRNYRAFDDTHPVTWRLQDGFVAFVGVNNSGKSSLLRFLHEMRSAFTVLERLGQGDVQAMFGGTPQPLAIQSVAYIPEVLCNRNGRDMTGRFSLAAPGSGETAGVEPSAIEFRWHRPDARMTVTLEHHGQPVSVADWDAGLDAIHVVHAGNRLRFDISRYRAAFAEMADAIYLGPFRNAVNVGGAANYYDLGIGEQFIAQWDAYPTTVFRGRLGSSCFAIRTQSGHPLRPYSPRVGSPG